MRQEAFDVGSAIDGLTPGRPLIVVDADEVILRFVDGFDRFLRSQALYLDLCTYRLHGNVKRVADKAPVLDVEVTALLEDFRRELDNLEFVEGATEALCDLSRHADIVVLSNIATVQGAARRRNLERLGVPYALVCNTGPKGNAVKDLSSRAGRPVFFIDDIGQHLASVAATAPDVLLIHLVGDDRLKPLLPPCKDAHLRAQDWEEAARFMRHELERAR